MCAPSPGFRAQALVRIAVRQYTLAEMLGGVLAGVTYRYVLIKAEDEALLTNGVELAHHSGATSQRG